MKKGLNMNRGIEMNKVVTFKAVNNTSNFQRTALKCGSSFSGVGAFEKALKNLGIHHVNMFAIENDQFAKKTYMANHKVRQFYGDIQSVNPYELPDVDCYMWSSPGKAFSNNGLRNGMSDKSAKLFYDGLYIVNVKKPKFFIFENVAGMLKNKTVISDVSGYFQSLSDYKLFYKILNTKEFGSAQNSERLVVVGVRNDVKINPLFIKTSSMKSINDFITKGTNYFDVMYDASLVEKVLSNKRSDMKQIGFFPHIRYLSDRFIYASSGIAPCFRTKNRHHFYDEINGIYRYLTLDEMARIQGFEDFIFPVSKTQTRKQIANATNINLLEALLETLLNGYLPKPFSLRVA